MARLLLVYYFMISNIDQTQYLAIKNYQNVSQQSNKADSQNFENMLKAAPETQKSEGNQRDRGLEINNGNEQEYDVLYYASNRSKSLKSIINHRDLTDISKEEFNDIADDLYNEEIITYKEYLTITSSLEENGTFAPENGFREDILQLWEERLSLLEKANSPKNVIDRTKNIIKILKNLQAVSDSQYKPWAVAATVAA